MSKTVQSTQKRARNCRISKMQHFQTDIYRNQTIPTDGAFQNKKNIPINIGLKMLSFRDTGWSSLNHNTIFNEYLRNA